MEGFLSAITAKIALAEGSFWGLLQRMSDDKENQSLFNLAVIHWQPFPIVTSTRKRSKNIFTPVS